MNHHLDTIAAQATAAGEGGIAIVRVSGSRCEEILSQVFRAKNGKPLVNRMLTFGHVMDGEEIVDEAMAVLMRAPHSYTREDVAEIHCHGSQALVRRILLLLLKAGARMAEPGEFTCRAFMNGAHRLGAGRGRHADDSFGQRAGDAQCRSADGGRRFHVRAQGTGGHHGAAGGTFCRSGFSG